MASKASRWNADESPLASAHGGTAKAALRAISEAKALQTTPAHIVAKKRKDRMRRRAMTQLTASGFRVMQSDAAPPFLPYLLPGPKVTAAKTPMHERVWIRCGGLCHYCDEPMMRVANERRAFTLDHVVPRSRGGSHHLSNIVGCCSECNHDKGSLTGEEYAAVLAVRRSKKERCRG